MSSHLHLICQYVSHSVSSLAQFRDPTKSTAKFASFTQVNWQGSTHFCGPTSELENFYIL